MKNRINKKRTAFFLAVIMIFMNCFYVSAGNLQKGQDSQSGTEIAPSISDEPSGSESGGKSPTILGDGQSESILKGEWQELGQTKWRISNNSTLEIYRADWLSSETQYCEMDYNFSWTPSDDGRTGVGEGEWLPYASQITKVTISSDCYLRNIPPFAFAGTSIKSFNMPKTVEEIGTGAFVDCKNLSTFNVKDNPRFYCDTDASSDNPNSILYKRNGDEYTLLFCPNRVFYEVDIIEGTISIAPYAFYGCSLIPNVNIPKTVKRINQAAFMGCTKLSTIKIGNRVPNPDPERAEEGFEGNSFEYLGMNAFKSCTSLRSIYIPDTFNTNISESSKPFANDSNLKYIIVYGTTTDVNSQDSPRLDTVENYLEAARTSATRSDGDETQIIKVPYNNNVVFFNKGNSTNRQDFNPEVVECGTKIYRNKMPTAIYEPQNSDKYYRFNGWWLGKNRYDVDDSEARTVNADITLTAKWIEYFYVTFNTNGGKVNGSDEVPSVSCDKGAKFSPSDWPEDPELNERDDVFIGWYDPVSHYTFINGSVDKAKKVNRYYAANPISIYDKEIPAFYIKRELKAVYKDFVTVEFCTPTGESIRKFTLPVGDRISGNDLAALRESEKLAPFENDDTRRWDGWYTRGGTQFNPNNDLIRGDEGKVYYATYSRYATIYYWNVNNEGTAEYSVSENIKVQGTTTYTIMRKPQIKGYRCIGWYEKPGGLGSMYRGVIYIDDTKLRYDLYAYFMPVFTVSTNDMKTTIGGETDTINTYEVVSGSDIYNFGRTPRDDIHTAADENHYAFAGWYTGKNGMGTLVDANSAIEKDMWVYACWNQGYLVSYYIDEAGAPYTQPYIAEYGSKLQIPESPSLEWADNHGYMGYNFEGWYTEPNGEGTLANSSIEVKGDMDFFGYWVDDPNRENWPMYTVSFNSMGGSDVPTQVVSINSILSVPDEPKWTDHKFLGWFKDGACTEEWDFYNDTVTEDRWLYAKWKYWTDDMEAEYQDNLKGIYWVKVVRGEKLSLAQYFKESGLKYTYDSEIVRFNKSKRVVKGKKVGSTLITAKRADGSDYKYGVRVFVVLQELQDMYAFTTNTTINAVNYLTVSGFLPDRWQSSNTKVASIDPKSGIIKVRGRGKSVIKAFYKNRPVKATLYSEVPKFSKPFVIMKTGQTKKLKIKKLKKYDIVSWNVVSQDSLSGGRIKSIGTAEIDDNGRITALTAGDVTVYANVYGQVISCKVHIEPPILSTSSLMLDVNKTKKLKLKRTKLKYVEWISSDDQIAYVDPVNGTVYALQPGRVVLKTTAGGVTNTCSIQVVDPALTKKKNKKK